MYSSSKVGNIDYIELKEEAEVKKSIKLQRYLMIKIS